MQVRLITTITTVIELTSGASLEEAKKEIFERYNEKLDTGEDYAIQDIQSTQTSSVHFDTLVASEVTHSFEEVK